MFVLYRAVLSGLLLLAPLGYSAVAPRLQGPDNSPSDSSGEYFWSSRPVDSTAELLTLNFRAASSSHEALEPIPLLSVLRDTLGDRSTGNDRLSALWLLSAGQPSLGQRLLSAVPFFYWKLGSRLRTTSTGVPKPLVDLGTPRHSVIASAGRTLVQWGAFDPLGTSVRGPTRSFQNNQSEIERIHLETASAYLHRAPLGSPGLNRQEFNTVMARLELRKSMLGGLLPSDRVAHFGEHVGFASERVASRNAEALRQFAEKTGTYFERLTIAGDATQFAILWFARDAPPPAPGASLKPIWKLLNIRDPWSDLSLTHWHGLNFSRTLDSDGVLLAPSATEGRSVTLIPLAVYSLSYPQMPLLLVDFRDESNVRRHEIVQRTISELTGGILGLSHFANWYYYAGAIAYRSLWARRGTATDQAARLDSYAQFQVRLALDSDLSPVLRSHLAQRAGLLVVNPLSSDPARNLLDAQGRFFRLARSADDPKGLPARLGRDRRAELAAFGASPAASFRSDLAHVLTFGIYTRRVPAADSSLTALDHARRLAGLLSFFDWLNANGSDPGVVIDRVQIRASLREAYALLESERSPVVQQHAKLTLARLRQLMPADEETAKSQSTALVTSIYP